MDGKLDSDNRQFRVPLRNYRLRYTLALPACLSDTGDETLGCHLTELDT